MAVIIPQAANDLVRSKFIGKDFDTYVTEIVQFMQLEFDTNTFNNFFASDLGIMLVETVAFALSQAAWYTDRQVGENFLETAVLRNSVARLSYQIGFNMPGAVPPSVDLTLTFGAAQSFNTTVPKGFQFSSASGLIYQTTADVLFIAGDVGPHTITAVQGQTAQEFFVSDGTANQIFQLQNVPTGQFIGAGTVTVSVDNVTWDPVDFLDFTASNQFAVELNREPPQIRFGDGIAGNIPANGSNITVTYVTTLGPAGTVIAGEIQQPVTPLIVGVTTIPLVVTNPNPSTAGGSAMTLDAARVLAPQVFSTAKRCVTEADFDAIINSFVDPIFGKVAVGKANIIRSMLEDSHFVTDLTNLNLFAGQIAAQIVVHSPNPNGNVTYVANQKGTVGNLIQVSHVNNGPSLPLTVTVTGPVPVTSPTNTNVVIQLATNISSVVTTIASDIPTLIMGNVLANQVLTATAEGSGAGLVTTFALTAMSGGAPNVGVQNIIKFDPSLPSTSWGTLPQELNAVVSADCEANLVEVQLLAADATGRYIAPTLGLAESLKTTLDSMKESTVQTLVFDGSRNLFPVNATISVAVIDGFAAATVLNQVQVVAQSFLLGFLYAQSVRISKLYELIEEIAGVDYSHIVFTVPSDPSKVDVTGDVVVNDNEVVTLGQISCNEI